ncbi:MAG TPA: aminodeoxychorismate/anthranilate synthase component II [Aliidongia sp.]|uniref:anthranilate synthase component II n=1 Tax=Aliidongia sp. TaxID=1914230 RepID=UPI002DDD50A8|nr:aminodeoxychorismate/anthranilate synthase component II [Aliidongia sp.]HEV2676395.1 aminodeoxychorismate/anthranilate synthase component II [Aliidongia sp.]
MKALLIDAYDSFVYIIRQYLLEAGLEVPVVRNDRITGDAIDAMAPDLIVLGPGPGHPADSGYVGILDRFAGRTPILGVCLGHQAIGLAFGGTVERARRLMHGKTSPIAHDGRGCFDGQAHPFQATRYHSLVVGEDSLPDCLTVSARCAEDGHIMGLRHRFLPIESVQFHPESIRTEAGARLFGNFVARTAGQGATW